MKKILNFILLEILVFSVAFFIFEKPVEAAWADHLVISEVQISGQTADDEFIELFNPADTSVDLTGCYIKKKNSLGNESNLVVSSKFENKTIQSRNFLLLAPEENYQGSVEPDILWPKSYKISPDYTIIFYNNSNEIIDKIGWGEAVDFEVTPFSANPQDNQSIERKASLYSSASTLAVGGQEVNSGNGWDTDNNNEDFVLQTVSFPQNSTSTPETDPPIYGPVCGNNICETGENYLNCPTDCFCGNNTCDIDKGENSTNCLEDCPVQENPVCGNNLKEDGEDCDGTDLDQKTCSLLGWMGGSLSCNVDCTFNTSDCNNGGSGGSGGKTYNSSDVVINELVSDPVDEEKEWVELYNRTDQEIDLTGWSLEDGTETQTKLSGKIPSQGFFVVENLKFSLNNAGDIVILRSPNSDLIDQVTYGNWNDGNLNDNALTAPDPKSLARISDGVDSNNDFLDFQATEEKTKDSGNKILESAPNSEQIVILNELLPNPVGDDQAGEFIELKNISDQNIDLVGWKIEDASGASYTILTKDFTSTIVESRKFFLLKREITGMALNNTGSEAIKFYNSTGQLVDSISYEGSIKENYAYGRDEDREWQWTNQLTPNAENIFDTNLETNNEQNDDSVSAKIIISEVLPNPVGSDSEEWLEIYNADSQDVNLKNWQLDDQEGGSSAYKIKNDLMLKPGQYLVFKKEETKISFNNSEDEVRLLSPNGKIIDEVLYEDVIEGFSYARQENDWFWTSALTPGSKNIIKEDSKLLDDKNLNNDQVLLIELVDIRQAEIGAKIKTSGVVSVGPGILGAQIFYLAGSGVQIYSYKKDFPSLKVGDLVEINGEVADYRGETRIKIAQKSDIKVMGRNQGIKIHQIKIDEIDESSEGSVVTVEGQLIESTGNYLSLDDGAGEIRVYIKTSTGIKKPKLKEGDWLKVTGIVSQSGEEYRLLPRFQDDIILLGQKTDNQDNAFDMAGSLSTADSSIFKNIFEKINDLGVAKYFIVSALFLVVVLVGLLIKRKK